MEINIQYTILKEIIDKRIAHAPEKIRESYPAVLQRHPISWITISPPEYLMVVFLDSGDENRIKEYTSKRFDPFPGLITLKNQGSAFRVEKSRYLLIQNCSVENAYALYLGKDSTVIMVDHKQKIKIHEHGQVEYRIPLAYTISYGDEINKATVYEYFDGLIAYSIKMWRGTSA